MATIIEDKLLVSRKQSDGITRTWQLLPKLDNKLPGCGKIRIHSFDVTPNGRSLLCLNGAYSVLVVA